MSYSEIARTSLSPCESHGPDDAGPKITDDPQIDSQMQLTQGQCTDQRNAYTTARRDKQTFMQDARAKSRTRDKPHMAEHSFIAVRKRHNVSYFVGNIDPDVTENEIYDHFKQNKVHLTHVRMFHGKKGSSAKINVPEEHEHMIQDSTFWPDGIVFRKWVSKEQWERTYQSRRRRHYAHNNADKTIQQNRWTNRRSHNPGSSYCDYSQEEGNEMQLGNDYETHDYEADGQYRDTWGSAVNDDWS